MNELMNVAGVGTEIVECLRIAHLIEGHGEAFLRRAFTAEEIRFCSARARSAQQYAAYWAAKEAILKALGIKLKAGISMRDIELRTTVEEHETKVCLGGRIRDTAARKSICDIRLSTSFCRNYATAFAVTLSE